MPIKGSRLLVLGMVSHDDSAGLEYDSMRVVGVCAFFLLVFGVGFWVVNPNAPTSDFSTLEWVSAPALSEGNLSPTLEFEILVSSFEQGLQSYSSYVYVNGREVKTNSFSLDAEMKNGLEYSISLVPQPTFPIEVRVRVEKVDVNGTMEGTVPLELVDWIQN
jgi:hypothetical protein